MTIESVCFRFINADFSLSGEWIFLCQVVGHEEFEWRTQSYLSARCLADLQSYCDFHGTTDFTRAPELKREKKELKDQKEKAKKVKHRKKKSEEADEERMEVIREDAPVTLPQAVEVKSKKRSKRKELEEFQVDDDPAVPVNLNKTVDDFNLRERKTSKKKHKGD